MNWLWKRGDSGPDRVLGQEEEEAVWFHNRPPPPYLAGTLKDHKPVSVPTLNDNELASAEALTDNELATAETFPEGELASAETLHEDELAGAETFQEDELVADEPLHENELASAEALHDDELAAADTLREDVPASAETFHEDELASAEALHDDELASAEALHDDELAAAETFQEDELASAETLHDDELAAAETLRDDVPASAETFDEDELAAAETFQEDELVADEPLHEDELASTEPFNDNERVSAPALGEHKRASIKNWGTAAAVACGLGLVLLYSWPVWDGQTSTDGRTARVTAHAGQASGAGSALGHYSAQEPANFNGAVSVPKQQGAPNGDSPAASAATGRPFEPQRASDGKTKQDVGGFTTTATADAQSQADTTSTGTSPAAAGASSAPIEAADSRTIAQAPTPPVDRAPATATAPPRGRIAPPVIRAPVGAGSSARLVRRSPLWIGGGPTDADNRGGRYQGTVAVRVTIEPGGRVTNCVPVRGSGDAGLDAMTCRLVQERARFNPALDAQGQPVVSQAYTTFVWGRRRR